jgi:hypothetical protein
MKLMTLRGIRNGRLRKFYLAGKLRGRFYTELGGRDTH